MANLRQTPEALLRLIMRLSLIRDCNDEAEGTLLAVVTIDVGVEETHRIKREVNMQSTAVLGDFDRANVSTGTWMREPAESHFELDRFFELSHEILCVLDERGNFRRVNEIARQILDVHSGDLGKRSFLQIVHADYRVFAQGQVRAAFERPESVRFTVLCQCQYGHERWIEWSIIHSDEPSALIVVGRDLTVGKSDQDDHLSRARAQSQLAILSPREWEVLNLVVAGSANKVIARRLALSEKTIERHRSHGMKKLQVTTVPDLVRLVERGNP